MGVADEGAGATVDIREKVSKNVYRCLALGERGEAHAIHVQLHRAWAETELEAN